ncbi:hypothetical protein [Pseudaestuariivita sp.]|uniref:hypothetical protein n=1 Tax=Pseudaestuariivita sp. TaxID=2211669 RepID=UPI00405828DE
MRYSAAFLILALAACGAPGPDLQGTEAVRITVGADTFDVRRKGLTMQAMRRNFRMAQPVDEIIGNAERAMEQLSGCNVDWLRGDVAIVYGGLACPNGAAPRPMPRSDRDLLCAPDLAGPDGALRCSFEP